MDNMRGAALMVLAMGFFALEDLFIKELTQALGVGMVLVLLGLGGGGIFAVIAAAQGRTLTDRALWSRPLLLRNVGEMIGTMGFVTAVALTPLTSASAILQATPLAVTLGAALFLGEQVGWRRWLAIGIGFFGVLMVIRPGLQGFEPASLFAVQGVLGLALRDLATRAAPPEASSMQISALRQLPHGAHGFGVARMADHHDLQSVFKMPLGLDMDLADQRAGGIDIDHLAPGGLGRDRFRHPMGGKDHRPVIGAILQLFDEHGALCPQPVDDIFVMHDLMAHIDRRAPFLQRHFDDLDGAVHPGAETARRGKV